MIAATGVELRFGATDVLSGVHLSTHPGQVIGLIGPNGSGKSTLLPCLYGMLRPHRGAVLIDQQAIESLPRRAIARTIAVVALAALDRMNLSDLAGRGLHELSGGERQQVMIARCVAQQSPVTLLDEPTNHLDIRYQHDILALVRRLALDTIVVLHDLNLANHYCDQLVLLDRGHVVHQGTPDEVLCSERLEPVYGIEVRRLVDGDRTHLAFGPPLRVAEREP